MTIHYFSNSAVEDFERAVQLKGEVERLKLAGHFSEAVKTLEEIIILEPNDLHALTELGALYAKEKNPAALPILQRAYDNSKDQRDDGRADPKLSYALGQLYAEAGQYGPARYKFREIKPSDPNHFAALTALARLPDRKTKPVAMSSTSHSDADRLGVLRTIFAGDRELPSVKQMETHFDPGVKVELMHNIIS